MSLIFSAFHNLVQKKIFDFSRISHLWSNSDVKNTAICLDWERKLFTLSLPLEVFIKIQCLFGAPSSYKSPSGDYLD